MESMVASFLCGVVCYNYYLDNYLSRRRRLSEELHNLLDRLEVVKGNVKNLRLPVPSDVQLWLDEVNILIDKYRLIERKNLKPEKLRQITLRVLPCTGPLFGSYRSIINRATREAEELVKRGEDIIKKSQYVDAYVPRTKESCISPQTSCKIQRWDEIAKLRELLAAENPSIIGIVGKNGMGKTTLMKELCDITIKQLPPNEANGSSSKDRFDKVIWAHVGPRPDISLIQTKIIKLLDIHPPDETDQKVCSVCIYDALAKINCVLFIDDVWEVLDLEKIGIPVSSKITSGSKIVITSRNLRVLQEIGATIVTLYPLNDDESWMLFNSHLLKELDTSNRELAKEIVRKCFGLPLAIIVIASVINDNPRLEVLQSLEKNADSGSWHDIHELVLYGLNEEEKSCLQYCSLFSTHVELDRIMDYFVGEQVQGSVSEGRKWVMNIIRRLQSTFYLEGRFPRYDQLDEVLAMRDFIRSACHDLNRGRNIILTDTMINRPESWNEAERIRVFVSGRVGYENDEEDQGNHDDTKVHNACEFPDAPLCPELYSLLFNGSQGISQLPRNFFIYMPLLRVLDLSNTNICVLPASVKSLQELRYLNLSNTLISMLPHELEFLVKLRLLYLKDMKHLRHIHEDAYYGLMGLQILNAYGSAYTWDESAIKILEECYALEDLGMSINDTNSLQLLLQSRLCHVIKYLELDVHDINLFKEVMEKVPAAKKVYVKSDITDDIHLQNNELQELEDLRIAKCSFRSINHTPNAFSRTLFRNLYNLEINRCHRLLDISWVQFIPLLKHLTLSNCCEVEIMIRRHDETPVKQEETSQEPLETSKEPLTTLKSLRLMHLPKMEKICDGVLTLRSVLYLAIMKCPMLKTLPLHRRMAEKLKKIDSEDDWWNSLKWQDPKIGVRSMSGTGWEL